MVIKLYNILFFKKVLAKPSCKPTILQYLEVWINPINITIREKFVREEVTMKENNTEKIGRKEVFSKPRRVFLQNYGHFFISRAGNILNYEQTLIILL